MRITQITPEFPPHCGGIGYYVFYLSKHLIENGNSVSVIVRGKENKTYDYQHIPITQVKVSLPPPFNILSFRNNIQQILSADKADLVHIHSTAMPTIKTNCPILVTSHWCNKQGIRTFHRPIRDVDSVYRNLMLPVYTQIESNLIKSCDKLTVVCESLKKEFLEHYNVASEVIYNGVDVDIFNVNKGQPKENAILFTGKFSAGKGVIDLLDLAELFLKSHPETRLYLVGNGPLRNKLKREIEKRGLSNVKLISYLPHSELISYYHRSMIYVLPAYYEGLPTTVLEAMACELPVIATNISGIPEQIEDGINGYLVPAGNVRYLYEKIAHLFACSEKRLIFGQNGRKKVLEEFTWEKVTQKIEALYVELLQRRE